MVGVVVGEEGLAGDVLQIASGSKDLFANYGIFSEYAAEDGFKLCDGFAIFVFLDIHLIGF